MLRGDRALYISAIPIRESLLSQMYARCQSDDEDRSRCCLIFPWISQCGRRQLCGRDAADVHPASVQDPDSSPSTSSQSHPGMGGGMNISYPKHLPSGLRFSIVRRKKNPHSSRGRCTPYLLPDNTCPMQFDSIWRCKRASHTRVFDSARDSYSCGVLSKATIRSPPSLSNLAALCAVALAVAEECRRTL